MSKFYGTFYASLRHWAWSWTTIKSMLNWSFHVKSMHMWHIRQYLVSTQCWLVRGNYAPLWRQAQCQMTIDLTFDKCTWNISNNTQRQQINTTIYSYIISKRWQLFQTFSYNALLASDFPVTLAPRKLFTIAETWDLCIQTYQIIFKIVGIDHISPPEI